jgi:L-malate glycosyltransferase
MLSRIKIVQVGPMFKTFGSPNGQGGGLQVHFSEIGATLYTTSTIENRVLRMIGILLSIIVRLPQSSFLLLHSFALRAFIMEDIVTTFALIIKKPILIRIHGGAFIEFFDRHPKWSRRILNRANIINTPSRYLQEELTKRGLQVEYLSNFINLQSFPSNRAVNKRHSLLWVRAFHEIYNPELAIITLSNLLKQYPDTTLTMIGHDQGSLSKCKELIKLNNLEGKVIITGRIPNRELYKFYQTHEVFLTTTRYESFGVAIMEAASCGTPCVSTRVGEIPHLWTDHENILFANSDPVDFASKVSELFENTELAGKLSLNASLNARKYSWENVKPLWLDTIGRLIKIGNVRN